VSATRAARRLLRRVRDANAKCAARRDQAHENTKTALGRERSGPIDAKYDGRLKADPAWQAQEKLGAFRAILRVGRVDHRRLRGVRVYRHVTGSKEVRCAT
jgi:hypothetical protein